MKRILVGISGASGAPITIRLLQRLKEIRDIETHLIMTDSACLTIEQETEYSVQQVRSLAKKSVQDRHPEVFRSTK